jgi:transcriptional regulator with XRE-family HTH domain
MSAHSDLKLRVAAWIDRQIGQRLRQRRIELGMTQDEIAAVLGLSYQQVQKYESGTNRIPTGRMYQMARHLDITVESLFEGLDSPMDIVDARIDGEGDPSRSRATIDLVRHFQRIDNSAHRSAVFALVRSLADAEAMTIQQDRAHEGGAASADQQPAVAISNVIGFRNSEKR